MYSYLWLFVMMSSISLVITIENTHTQLILPCAIPGIRAIKKQKTEVVSSPVSMSPWRKGIVYLPFGYD